jgi:hypothetical protein
VTENILPPHPCSSHQVQESTIANETEDLPNNNGEDSGQLHHEEHIGIEAGEDLYQSFDPAFEPDSVVYHETVDTGKRIYARTYQGLIWYPNTVLKPHSFQD